MKRINKWWIALLLGALLMTALVGVVWARPKASPAYKVTIPAAHFNPIQDGLDWYNGGYSMTVDSGSGYFYAALPIALPGRFTVEKVTLFAEDYNGTYNVHAYLYRLNPWTGAEDEMASVSTVGTGGGIQARSTTNIGPPDTIYGSHGAYIYLYIPSSSQLEVYAVQVDYH